MAHDRRHHGIVVRQIALHREELSDNLRFDDELRHNCVCFALRHAISLVCDVLEVLTGVNHEEEGLVSNDIQVVVAALKVDRLVTQVRALHELNLIPKLWRNCSLIVELSTRLRLVVVGLCFICRMYIIVCSLVNSHLYPHWRDVLLDFFLWEGNTFWRDSTIGDVELHRCDVVDRVVSHVCLS